MIRCQDVGFTFDQKVHFRFPDMHCRRGEHWLVLGQSGSGKTTLLNLIAGLRRPSQGSVWVNEENVAIMSPSVLDRFRGQNIGIVFQQSHFLRSLTVKENLGLAQSLAGLKVDDHRIAEVLSRLGIADKASSKPHRLSVGEAQRASIGRALVNRPKIILADEPTSALDDFHCNEVVALLKEEASNENITLVIVTHDSRLKSVFDRSVVLQNIRT